MGCDWIEFDKNFEKKPKALRLMALTGANPDQLAGRLTRFWSWVDDHVGADARLGLELEALPLLFGGDVAFWEALLDPDICWLKRSQGGKLKIPRWEIRFGTSAHQRRQATRRQRRKRIREAELNGHANKGNLSRSARDKSVTTRQDTTGQDLNTSLSSSTTTKADVAVADRVELSREDWLAALALCQGSVQQVHPRNAVPEDRSLNLKAAALAIHALGADWYTSAAASVEEAYARRRPPKVARCGYFHTVLAKSAAGLGIENFNAVLKRVIVPDKLLNPEPVGATP